MDSTSTEQETTMAKVLKSIFGTYADDNVRWARGVGPLVMPRR